MGWAIERIREFSHSTQCSEVRAHPENERNNPKKRKQRKKKELDTKHELGVSSSEKQMNGLVLKKVEFLDVPFI